MRVLGASLEELFQNAALAAAALFVNPATVQAGGFRDRLRAEAADREALLVRWLEAVVHQVAINRVALASVRVRRLEESGGKWTVEADADGELLDPGRHDVLKGARPLLFQVSSLRPLPAGGWMAVIQGQEKR